MKKQTRRAYAATTEVEGGAMSAHPARDLDKATLEVVKAAQAVSKAVHPSAYSHAGRLLGYTLGVEPIDALRDALGVWEKAHDYYKGRDK
jgi:hypothetical protein